MRCSVWVSLFLFVGRFTTANVDALLFVPHARYFKSIQGPPTARQFSAKDDDADAAEDTNVQPFPIHFMASDEVVLPGEVVSLSLRDEESIPLMQHCLDQNSGSLAVGVNLDTDSLLSSSVDGAWRLAQVASHCDIVGITVADNNDDRVLVKLLCVGRVRLSEVVQQYSAESYRFTAEWIDEPFVDKQEFDKALLLEKNIQLLMKKASKMEIDIRNAQTRKELESGDTKSTVYLYNSFIRMKATVSRAISKDLKRQYGPTNTHQSIPSVDFEDMQSLVATSWAVFLCLKDESLETRYRLRAFDWDNLLERLKLAQYALREKELLLQGQLIRLETSPQDDAPTGATDYLDAFQ